MINISTYNQGDGLKFVASLDTTNTRKNFQQQLEDIAKELSVKVTAQFDDQSLNNVLKKFEDLQKQISNITSKPLPAPILDSSGFDRPFQEIKKLTTDGMKVVEDIIQNVAKSYGIAADEMNRITKTIKFDPNTGGISEFTLNIQKAQGEIEKLKYIADQAGTPQVGSNGLVTQAFKLAPQAQTIDKSTESTAKLNDQLNSMVTKLQEANVEMKDFASRAQGLMNSNDPNAVAQLQKEIDDWIKLGATQSSALAKNASINDQMVKADESAYAQAINQKIKLIETFNNLGITSSQETFTQLKQLYEQNSQYFAQNIDKNIAMLNKLNDAEIAANSPEKSMSSGSGIANRNQPLNRQYMNTSGFGMTPLNMGITLAQIQLESTLINNIRDGFVALQQGSAGLQQVFGDTIKNQSQLNDVTNQFVAVAQKYGASVDDVVTSAKLWGRQYKDVETALTLTNNATLLSIVDNLSVADSNKAVESSMNAMGESVQNAGQAYNDSMKLVDSWSAVSHAASVSASDLTQGFERSAAAAHNAGITIDQLNSLIASGVRATGRSGSVIGWNFLAA